MNPHKHALASANKYGGKWEDYIPIHEFLDSPKICTGNLKSRVLFHNSFGPYVAERIFGNTITNSDGKLISVRQVCEDHIMEDMGGIVPSLDSFLNNLQFQPWMAGNRRFKRKTERVIEFKDTDEGEDDGNK